MIGMCVKSRSLPMSLLPSRRQAGKPWRRRVEFKLLYDLLTHDNVAIRRASFRGRKASPKSNRLGSGAARLPCVPARPVHQERVLTDGQRILAKKWPFILYN